MPSSPKQGSKERSAQDRGGPFWALAVIVGLVLVNASVAGLIVLAVKYIDVGRFQPEITTATVLIIGVIGLLSAIGALLAIFNHYGMNSPGHALGLPGGSIRAVIALALLLIFAIYGVYLHGRATTEARLSTCLTRGQVAVIPTGTVMRVKAAKFQRGTQCTKSAPKTPKAVKPRSNSRRDRQRARRQTARARRRATRNTVTRYTATVAVANTEREHISTQLLSTVATLVVAVAGFYFGAKAVEAGQRSGADILGVGRRRGRRGENDEEDDEGGKGVTGRSRSPTGGGAGDTQDEHLYGSHSPSGLTGADVRDELHSTPLAEEDEGEESLREQGTEEEPEEAEPEDAAPDEDDFEEPADEEPAEEASEGEEEALYGTTSPVTPSVTAADLHDELESAPLAEEEDAEDEEPTEAEEADEEPAEEDMDEEPEPKPAPEDDEPPKEA